MSNSLTITFKHATRIILMSLIAAGSLQLGHFPTPQTAQAATTNMTLASSNLAENYSKYVPLRDYRSLGTAVTNWPTRSPDCVGNSTGYKTFPWQPANGGVPGHSDSGNDFVASGNCSDRYVDAGSSNGAWADPSLYGGWTTGTGSGGFGAPSYGHSVNFTCSLPGGSVPMLWGSPGNDLSEQAYGPGGMMGQNNYSTVNPGYGLYGNGTSFFRNTFNVADPSKLTNFRMYFQADDWMNVYLNGQRVITTTWTSVGGYYSISPSYLVAGANILAVQVTDKSVWLPSDIPGARGSGLCYNLTADVDSSSVVDMCPNIPGNQATIPPGMILDVNGNCVIPPPVDVCPNIAGIQLTIPPGKILDVNGNCVDPPPPPLPAVSCTTTDPVGECVVMNGQLYINPPKFFDNTFGLNLTQSQGERPPLY